MTHRCAASATFIVVFAAWFGAQRALAEDVTTTAGSGASGSSGDGGPAITAALNAPHGMAIAADGTVYIADTDNYRVRRISPDGTIDTIVGTGTFGDDGDGGQASAATLSGLLSIALSPAGDLLYIADIDNNRVRQVDLASGVISNFAGAGWLGYGYDGDGGPATTASLATPEGLAVDAEGNVYIADINNCIIRRVDAVSHIIDTVAGVPAVTTGDCVASGDGGDALHAHFSVVRRMAVDPAGNLFVLDSGSDTVRRVDAVTHIITTIAGGGATTPGLGDATTMNLGTPSDLALDATNNLYISNYNQVFKVDLGAGVLSVFAGTGVSGFSGDGGPAQHAKFQDIGGLLVRADDVLIADAGNHRIRAVAPPPPPDDLVVEADTLQAVLDSVQVVAGSILMINVDGRDYLVVPNATSVGLGVTVTDNDQLLAIDLGALQSVGGSITISGNLVMQSIDMSSLATVDGSLTITGNPALSAILISGVTSIGGDFTVTGTAATVLDMSSLTTVTGSLDVSANPSATTIDMSSLTSVGGSLTVSDNPAATAIDMSALATVSSDLVISGNITVASLDLSGLGSAGSITVSDNTSASVIDMSGLGTVGGDLIVIDNGDATVDISGDTDVGGDLTVETTGSGVFSMGDGVVAGDLSLDATGYTDMSATTPGGALDLTVTQDEAVMHLQLQAATFTTPVRFSVTRIDHADLVPESGFDDSAAPATIEPIAAYRFTFAVPALDHDATLSFDIDVARLDAATQTTLLSALAAGTATLVTKSDAASGTFQAFPICAAAEAPTLDGCVRVETFDALGQPTSGTPAIVRFSNVVGHFSTWAVAVVTPATDGCADAAGCDGGDAGDVPIDAPVPDAGQVSVDASAPDGGPVVGPTAGTGSADDPDAGAVGSIDAGARDQDAPSCQCNLSGTRRDLPGGLLWLSVLALSRLLRRRR